MPEVDSHINEVVQIERRFIGWLVGATTFLALGATVTVGSLLWNLNTSVVSLRTTVDTLSMAVGSLQQQMTVAANDKYTATSAAADRNSFSAAVASDRAAMLKLIDTVNIRLAEHEKEIRDLAVFDALVRGQLKIGESSSR